MAKAPLKPRTFALTKLHALGGSLGILVPRIILAKLTWTRDDSICMRVEEGKIVCERVPIELLAKITTR